MICYDVMLCHDQGSMLVLLIGASVHTQTLAASKAESIGH